MKNANKKEIKEISKEVKKESNLQQITAIMKAYSPEYFLDENAEAHIQLKINNVMRAYAINSEEFKEFLQNTFYKLKGEIISYKDLKSFVAISSFTAKNSGNIRELPLRVAQDEFNIIYDLSREDGKQVLITPRGWKVVPQMKLFRHRNVSISLPQTGGKLNDLIDLINIQGRDQMTLVLTTLLSYFIPNISHPLMILTGSQGSAKTTMARIFKMIVDPDISEVTYLNSSIDSLELILEKSYLTCFDNLSGLSVIHFGFHVPGYHWRNKHKTQAVQR
jgi:hypothetical protein